MKQFFLNLVAGAFADAGESKLEEVLQKLHDTNPGQYKVAILAGRELVKALQPLVDKTPNGIDDAFLKALGEAVEDSAKANGGVEKPISE